MASHSSIIAWRIPRTEEPGRLQSMGLQRVRHNLATNTFTLRPFLMVCYNKVPQIGWLQQQKYWLLTFPETGSLRLGCQHGQVLLRALSGLQTAIFLLYLHLDGVGGWGDCALVPLSPRKGTNPIMGAPPPWAHANLIIPQGPASTYHHTRDWNSSMWIWIVFHLQRTITFFNHKISPLSKYVRHCHPPLYR